MTKRNQDRLIILVLLLAVLFFSMVATACGSDSDEPAPVKPAAAEATPVQPTDDPIPGTVVDTYCTLGFRVFISHTYYTDAIAVVADPLCPQPQAVTP